MTKHYYSAVLGIVRRYKLLQVFLRRYPLMDAVVIYELAGFAFAAFMDPVAVTLHSHFGRVTPILGLLGVVCLLVSLYHLFGAFLDRSGRHRQIAATCSWVLLLGLTASVDSITGLLSWSGHSLSAFLIVLAVVE